MNEDLPADGGHMANGSNANDLKEEDPLQDENANEPVGFLEKSQVVHVISIGDLKVCINLNTIINFGGQNLEYFEKEFFKLYPESEEHNVEKTTLANCMFKYMEKCMQIAAGYQAEMKNLHPQALDQLKEPYLSLDKGGKSLEKIHLEFIKKYKNNFSFPPKGRQS